MRLPLILRHILYNLRGGFLLRPLAIALTLGWCGAIFSWLEEYSPRFSAWVPALLFPTQNDPGVAQVILASIATSIMTVVSIVFAILLMTLTLASMQFSPRILISFSRDRTTQWTLGIFLGTFSYCMAALPAAHSMPRPFAPTGTIVGAMVLALACVGWLLYFIHHISQAISVNFIVERIAAETEAIIRDTMPHARRILLPGQDAIAGSIADSISWDSAISSLVSGYIRFIDIHRLFAVARLHRVRLRVTRSVGGFVPQGAPLMEVCRGERLSANAVDDFRRAFDIGPSRTLQQDVEYGVLQIVDIALRAISPAVNDPSTAINCIDQLSRIMIVFASRQEPVSWHYDLPGEMRVIVPWISFDKLLHSAFDQIRRYSTGDAAVSIRLLRALHDIAATCDDEKLRAAVVSAGHAVIDGCDRQRMDGQWSTLQQRLVSLQQLATRPRRLTDLYPLGALT